MFTGIIQEIGKVKSITGKGGNARLRISCVHVDKDLGVGDSVAVNGVCLSVVSLDNGLAFDVVGNTLDGTNLKRLKAGDLVNLENAMKAGDKVSGHMVSGHIDGMRAVRSSMNTSKGRVIDIASAKDDERYLLPKGSVAIDGVSLTVSEIHDKFFRIYLIPLTLEKTTLKLKKTGDYVNVEFDMMAKYAEKHRGGNITKEMLRQTGFL